MPRRPGLHPDLSVRLTGGFVLLAGAPWLGLAILLTESAEHGYLTLSAGAAGALRLFATVWGLGGLAAGWFVWAFLRARLSQPLREITEQAEQLLPEPRQRLAIRRDDELAAAARTLQELATQLEVSDQDLREQIAGRTRSLGVALGELQLLRKLNEAIIHNIPVGLAILEQQGRLLYINEEFSQAWGVSAVQLGGELREVTAGTPLGSIDWTAELALLQLAGQRRERILETGEGPSRRVVRYNLYELPPTDLRAPLEMVGESFCLDFLSTPGCEQDCENCFAHSATWAGRHWLLLIDDITEQRSMEAQLIQSEKLAALGQLSAGVAHEMRNPLSAIYSAAFYIGDVLADDDVDVADLQQYVQLIQRNVERAQRIVTDILNFARPQGAEVETVDLAELVGSTLGILDKSFLDQQVELQRELEPVMTECRPETIKQALLNLIVNALQAMPSGGTLTLRCGRRDQRAVLEVRDTGCGIPAEHLRQVFNPFFSTKPAGQGTGLGLSIARQAIEQDRGRLEVTSEQGVGTTFRITLPLAETAAALTE